MRLCRFDHDASILLDDALLLVALQISRRLCTRPQRLDRLHDLLLVGEESIANLLRPVELVVHHGQHLRECGERLNAGIPILPCERLIERISLETRILLHEACSFHDLQRVRRRNQHLRKQLVGIESDRSEQRIELILRQRCRRLGWIRHCVRRRRSLRFGNACSKNASR